jgi:phosphate transport system permease protein
MALSTDKRPVMPRQRSILARKLDTGFVRLTGVFGVSVGLLLLVIAAKVGLDALPAVGKLGLSFLNSGKWNLDTDTFGALPQIYGTLVSSAIALALALPIGLGVSIFLSEDFLPQKLQQPLVFMVELLAAIPSVVYGLWGIFVLTPFLQGIGLNLHQGLGWIPFFSTRPIGPGMYVAGVILAIMILPIIAAISRDALAAVPAELRQAAYGLGATRWETLLKVVLPTASSGIVGGVMLALGRAMGETMATTMVIGNANRINVSLFDQGSTIASLLANKFAEAKDLEISALMYAAFVLFLITLVVNVLAELIVRRVRMKV